MITFKKPKMYSLTLCCLSGSEIKNPLTDKDTGTSGRASFNLLLPPTFLYNFLITSPPEIAVSPWSLLLITFFNVCPFDCTTAAGSGEVLPFNLRLTRLSSLQFTPKSVSNRCVIERFVAFLCYTTIALVFVILMRHISSLLWSPV